MRMKPRETSMVTTRFLPRTLADDAGCMDLLPASAFHQHGRRSRHHRITAPWPHVFAAQSDASHPVQDIPRPRRRAMGPNLLERFDRLAMESEKTPTPQCCGFARRRGHAAF